MTMANIMHTAIGAGDFKAKCLQLLDDVENSREPLLITKRGKPVAKLVPVEPEHPLFGALQGSVVSEGDLLSPLEMDWDVAR